MALGVAAEMLPRFDPRLGGRAPEVVDDLSGVAGTEMHARLSGGRQAGTRRQRGPVPAVAYWVPSPVHTSGSALIVVQSFSAMALRNALFRSSSSLFPGAPNCSLDWKPWWHDPRPVGL
jgi:hypothetical protein